MFVRLFSSITGYIHWQRASRSVNIEKMELKNINLFLQYYIKFKIVLVG